MPSTAIPILMYHNVERPRKQAAMRGLYVVPAMFRLQMRLLRLMGYQGLCMGALMPYLRGEKSGKVVGITFDDGYRDNLCNALPALAANGFTATCYLVEGAVGGDNRWDQAKGIDAKPLMGENEVHQWLAAGMEIGCHTRDHVNLAECPRADLAEQIGTSKHALEQAYGVPVAHFCYPYGAWNEAALAQVRAAGYLSATTTRRGRARVHDDPLLLPRVPVYRSTLPHLFWAKIRTAYEDRRG